MNILIIEDVESKFNDVQRVISECVSDPCVFSRASNLVDAEDAVTSNTWDLVIVDLSMDINGNGSMQGAGHATLGGLDVLEIMSLLKRDSPVILVTGFDSFQDQDRFDNAIMNLADIDGLALKWLGNAYIGCVRYGSENWSKQLNRMLQKWGR